MSFRGAGDEAGGAGGEVEGREGLLAECLRLDCDVGAFEVREPGGGGERRRGGEEEEKRREGEREEESIYNENTRPRA